MFVDGADDGDLFRVIFLDEDVDLKVLVIARVTGRDLFSEFAFGETTCLYLVFDMPLMLGAYADIDNGQF